ncbi:MAG: DUF72 domain-containing protein [Chthoniobacterales bacterium]
MNIWIGTSGFQYPEWKGTFYPDDMPAAKMLPFYAEHFSTTEINYSFRRIPSAKTISSWSTITPQNFKFSLKAPQKITHFAKLRNTGDTLAYFHKVVSALEAKLGPILFQLPPSLQKDVPLLSTFLETIPLGMRAAFEFRHPSWFSDEVFSELQSHNVALCIAESANLSTPSVATADFGYLRLRREDYVDADIHKWAAYVRLQPARWQDVFIYYKHEESGVGPKFAAQMKSLLEQK